MLKIKFSVEEDELLAYLVRELGTKGWKYIAQLMRTRNARQCRDRWNNYLNPALRMGGWTKEEDELLLKKYALFGSKWSKIAKHFKRRSDLSIRNRCHMLERRRMHICLESVPTDAETDAQFAPQKTGAAAPMNQNPFDGFLSHSEEEDFDLFGDMEKRTIGFSFV
jgi:hypothetical protein